MAESQRCSDEGQPVTAGPATPSQPATEWAHVTTRNGLTYASLNGREVCPDILIVAGATPEQAVEQLMGLRARRLVSVQPDLEWDPPAPGERVPDERKVTWE